MGETTIADIPTHCEHLTKRYGERLAFSDLDVQIHPGEIVALVGPNGAGKSSLIGCMTGLLEPSQGAVTVWGEKATELTADNRARVGYVPQNFTGFSWFRVGELLDYLGQFYPENRRTVWPSLAEWADLDAKARVKQLSGGGGSVSVWPSCSPCAIARNCWFWTSRSPASIP